MSGEHGEFPVAARVRRLEERLIAAGLATDEELDDILEQVFHFSRALGADDREDLKRAFDKDERR